MDKRLLIDFIVGRLSFDIHILRLNEYYFRFAYASISNGVGTYDKILLMTPKTPTIYTFAGVTQWVTRDM